MMAVPNPINSVWPSDEKVRTLSAKGVSGKDTFSSPRWKIVGSVLYVALLCSGICLVADGKLGAVEPKVDCHGGVLLLVSVSGAAVRLVGTASGGLPTHKSHA
jgi:hypothetical protein